MILIPSTISGTTARGSIMDGNGDVDGRTRHDPVALADVCTVDEDMSLDDQLGCAGARKTEHASERGVDTLACQPFGHRKGPVVDGLSHSSRSRALSRVPSIRMPRNACSEDQPGRHVDADVGHVEHRPVRHHQEVDDMASERCWIAEHAGR